jgi:hypothetical protein
MSTPTILRVCETIVPSLIDWLRLLTLGLNESLERVALIRIR